LTTALPLTGTIEHTGSAGHSHQRILRTVEPSVGMAHSFAMKMGPQTVVRLRLYFFGGGPIAETEWRA
jgi:hypothetical protein